MLSPRRTNGCDRLRYLKSFRIALQRLGSLRGNRSRLHQCQTPGFQAATRYPLLHLGEGTTEAVPKRRDGAKNFSSPLPSASQYVSVLCNASISSCTLRRVNRRAVRIVSSKPWRALLVITRKCTYEMEACDCTGH